MLACCVFASSRDVSTQRVPLIPSRVIGSLLKEVEPLTDMLFVVTY